jgi:pimeloyl-ACP methyl ester carboxylesterase
MNKRILFALLSLLMMVSCREEKTADPVSTPVESGHADINGLRMYYEIYGEGKPLVLIHGGGSTIQTSFGRLIPHLARNRKLIAMELQAHGRTADRRTPLSFEQDADDVAGLLKHLGVEKADILGFSNGGTTALQVAIRHPEKVSHLVICSALVSRDGAHDEFWNFMKHAKIEYMPRELKDAYTRVAPDSSGLQAMHDRCAARMVNFVDIPAEQIRSVKAPVLIVTGDRDVCSVEHMLALHRSMEGSRLAVLPGGHGEYMGEITTLQNSKTDRAGSFAEMILAYLEENEK